MSTTISMELQFRIARHYWLKGKNATWAVSNLFDRNVLVWLKNQYSILEEGRPNFKELDNKIVFFFYTDGRDVYGRKITEILTVLVDASFTSPEHVRKLISDHLVILSSSDLEFNLFLENSYIISTHTVSHNESDSRPKSRSLKVFTVLSSLLVIFIGISFLFLSIINTLKRSP